MTFNQVSRDNADVSTIDKGVKNKFKWNWLEEKDSNKMFYSDWVRKVDLPGRALCLLCNTLLKYGSQGKSALAVHAKKPVHKGVITAVSNNSTLPVQMNLEVKKGACNLTYCAAPNIHSDAYCSAQTEDVLPKIPSFVDRLAHNEAFLLSFLAENTLPFTMAPRLIEFAKFMAKDLKVLAKIKMDRTTASYKLTDGLAPVILEKIIESLRSSFFSMNVDECFSNNHKKIFSILVSYFCEEMGEVMVQHYRSKEFDTVNAKNLSTFHSGPKGRHGLQMDLSKCFFKLVLKKVENKSDQTKKN